MVSLVCSRASAKSSQKDVLCSYVTFMIGATVVYNALSDGLSSLLTLSAGLQALALVMLLLKVQSQSSVCGISARMLWMYVLTLAFRLCSTLCVEGYLPADATGDWAYQCLEVFALVLAVWLLRRVLHTRQVTFMGATQDDHDCMPGLPYVALTCVLLGVVIHPNLNHDHIFDSVWASACYLETVAMLPQLWMMSKAGGEVESLTSHFVALMALARICSLAFWYLAFEDGIGMHGNPSEMAIIGAHLIQLVLSCDFLVLYVQSFRKRAGICDVSSQWI